MLICKICGGTLAMDESFEKAVCAQCGVEYPKAALQRLFAAAQQEASPAAAPAVANPADQLASNAETYMKLGETAKAAEVYTQMVKQFPQDWRGWWGRFLIPMQTLSLTTLDDFRLSEKNAQNAFQLAGTYPSVIQAQYATLWDGFLEKLQTPFIEQMAPQLFAPFYRGAEINLKEYNIADMDVIYAGISKKLIEFIRTGRDNALRAGKELTSMNEKYSAKYFQHFGCWIVSFPESNYGSSYGLERNSDLFFQHFGFKASDRYGSNNIVFCVGKMMIYETWTESSLILVNAVRNDLKRHVIYSEKPAYYDYISEIVKKQKDVRCAWKAQGKCPFCGGTLDYKRCTQCQTKRKYIDEYK